MPYRADNALLKAAEVITRIGRYRAPLRLHDLWKRFVEGLDLPAASRLALTTGVTFDAALDRAPAGTAPMLFAATRTTFSPNIAHAGVKLNVIPDSAEIDVDIRTLPGDDGEKVREMLRDAIGDLWAEVEIVDQGDNPATESPRGTPLWETLTDITRRLVPGSETIPFIVVGATDARYFRRKGVVAYGYGLMSERIPFGEFAKMFHGNNERIDQESLRLTTELWTHTARDFLS
jgi:acetylornithine deacetylase/succinyl-diaminopimelate desuccinylase-like protein